MLQRYEKTRQGIFAKGRNWTPSWARNGLFAPLHATLVRKNAEKETPTESLLCEKKVVLREIKTAVNWSEAPSREICRLAPYSLTTQGRCVFDRIMAWMGWGSVSLNEYWMTLQDTEHAIFHRCQYYMSCVIESGLPAKEQRQKCSTFVIFIWCGSGAVPMHRGVVWSSSRVEPKGELVLVVGCWWPASSDEIVWWKRDSHLARALFPSCFYDQFRKQKRNTRLPWDLGA